MYIITSYIGPTDTKGAKIQARADNGTGNTVAYDHSVNQEQRHRLAAEKLFDRIKRAGKIDANSTLHLINNRTHHSGFTFQVR